MIEVLPVKDKDELKKILLQNGVDYNDNMGCVAAKYGTQILGFCIYELLPDKITVIKLEPTNDLLLCDGILRSTLHVADFNGVAKAFYANEEYAPAFKKLGFIKNEQDMSLLIDKLHETHCSCEKIEN